MDSLYIRLNMKTGKKEMICIVGAGGKTSALFRLAGELSAKGGKVLVTTTTAIYTPERKQYDQILISEEESLDLFDNRSIEGITVFGRSISYEGKLLGVTPKILDDVYLSGIFDYIIVEGDGSKGRPVKAPAKHEPVIPSHTTKLLGIIGLDCIGKGICQDNVHRPELFCAILNCKIGDIIDTDSISRLITHENGLFKGAPALSEKHLILNKAEGEKRITDAYDIAQRLLASECKLAGIVISSMEESSFNNISEGGKI